MEYLVLRQLGQPATGQPSRQRLRYQLGAELDIRQHCTKDHSVTKSVCRRVATFPLQSVVPISEPSAVHVYPQNVTRRLQFPTRHEVDRMRS